MASLILATAVAVLALYGASWALSTARQVTPSLPYESGSKPEQHAASRYHVRWYAVSVLFLAFDMEMVFMYPWAVVVADMGASSLVEMFGFLLVLLVGVGYVWREGALRWS
ncbi:MAG TPA: NADH-quinone oxidoreductase subunit A [Mycobacterium sp.]|nr:NADH-quinone oxidoreductase subunit A [Mycobacterium sp.]